MLQIEAITAVEYHQAVSLAEDAIGKCGGWIVNHTFFSSAMAMIAFEMEKEQLQHFSHLLEQCSLRVTKMPQVTGASKQEIAVQLTLVFSGERPDVRRTVIAN